MHLLGLALAIGLPLLTVIPESGRTFMARTFELSPEIATLILLGYLYPLCIFGYCFLNKSHNISRQFFRSQTTLASTLCVSLGLIGTFIGLSSMVASIATGMNAEGDFSSKIGNLLTAIGESLDSMSLAFLTSIMGVGASTVLIVACNYLALYYEDDESTVKMEKQSGSKAQAAPFDITELANKMGRSVAQNIDLSGLNGLKMAIEQNNQMQKQICDSLQRIESNETGIPPELLERLSGALENTGHVAGSSGSSQARVLLDKVDERFNEYIQDFRSGMQALAHSSDRLYEEMSGTHSTIHNINQFLAGQEDNTRDLRQYISELLNEQAVSVGDLTQLLSDLKFLLAPPLDETLAEALDYETLSLNFQPQYNTMREIKGFEVLLHWVDNIRGEVKNRHIFETKLHNEHDLLKRVDRWVIDETLRILASWNQDDRWESDWIVSINVTPAHSVDMALVSHVRDSLARFKVSPSNLAIEIKEHAFTANPEAVKQVAMGLKDLGLKVYVDNYGIENASLAHYKRMGVDSLKVDQSVTQALFYDEDDLAELRSLFVASEELKLGLIVEGVERETQLNRLSDIGFSVFQGDYFCKPVKRLDELTPPDMFV